MNGALVWVWPEKTREPLGRVRWVCEWHTVPETWKPEFEGDSPDPDMLFPHRIGFASEEEAKKRARIIQDSGVDYYGCVIVQKQIVDWYVEEDRVAEWSDVSDPIYVE